MNLVPVRPELGSKWPELAGYVSLTSSNKTDKFESQVAWSPNGAKNGAKSRQIAQIQVIQVTFSKWLEGRLWQILHIHLLEADLPAMFVFGCATLRAWLFLVGLRIRLSHGSVGDGKTQYSALEFSQKDFEDKLKQVLLSMQVMISGTRRNAKIQGQDNTP